MKNILPAPPIEITRTIKEKIFIICWTWFLLIFVYQNIFYHFIEDLNSNGKINFGPEFHSYYVVWGEHVFQNVLKILIDAIIAVLGGITVGYLFTRARITFKFFFSFFSSVIQHFYYFFLILLTATFMTKENSNEGIGQALFYVLENARHFPICYFFLLFGFVVTFSAYYYGINLGIKIKEGDYLGTDTNSRKTFLDIKWYHWLWFWLPVCVYFQAILRLAYFTVVATITALKHWKWYNLFGVTTSNSGNEPLQDIGGILFWGYIAILVVFFILYLIWEFLSGRKKFKNKILTSLIIILLSFVLPLLVIFLPYWFPKHK